MTTKNLRAVLEWVARGDAPPELAGALAELVAIEEATQTRAELAEWIAEGDTAALERLAQMACDERNSRIREGKP